MKSRGRRCGSLPLKGEEPGACTAHVLDCQVNNAATKKAIAELVAGKGEKFTNVDDLIADLHADD